MLARLLLPLAVPGFRAFVRLRVADAPPTLERLSVLAELEAEPAGSAVLFPAAGQRPAFQLALDPPVMEGIRARHFQPVLHQHQVERVFLPDRRLVGAADRRHLRRTGPQAHGKQAKTQNQDSFHAVDRYYLMPQSERRTVDSTFSSIASSRPGKKSKPVRASRSLMSIRQSLR